MDIDYHCLNCEFQFAITVTEIEWKSSLNPVRTDACPECAQQVGKGPVRCRNCGETFELAFPHWHVTCDLARGNCPVCKSEYLSLCIC